MCICDDLLSDYYYDCLPMEHAIIGKKVVVTASRCECGYKRVGVAARAMAFLCKKKIGASKAYSDVVRRKGLEPPTYWFVASHSIQLSYRRTFYERHLL